MPNILSTLGVSAALYLMMGVLTLQPTQRALADRCYTVVRAGPHVALWPFSVLALSRLPSRC